MTLARLLPVVLVVCIVPAYAQKPADSPSGQFNTSVADKSAAANPWKLGLNQPTEAQSEQNPIDRMRIDEFRIDPNGLSSKVETPLLPKAEASSSETTCFKIRSYVVARDSKGSGATHPVGYSTCSPAIRYGVKTVETAPSLER
jgi:hypothetical protein